MIITRGYGSNLVIQRGYGIKPVVLIIKSEGSRKPDAREYARKLKLKKEDEEILVIIIASTDLL